MSTLIPAGMGLDGLDLVLPGQDEPFSAHRADEGGLVVGFTGTREGIAGGMSSECRRYAPRAGDSAAHPWVQRDHWCGEFQSRTPQAAGSPNPGMTNENNADLKALDQETP